LAGGGGGSRRCLFALGQIGQGQLWKTGPGRGIEKGCRSNADAEFEFVESEVTDFASFFFFICDFRVS
jgi:hypothetical protein